MPDCLLLLITEQATQMELDTVTSHKSPIETHFFQLCTLNHLLSSLARIKAHREEDR